MTQAELAGGMANAPQARPAKGQLIRDFTLISTLGQPIVSPIIEDVPTWCWYSRRGRRWQS